MYAHIHITKLNIKDTHMRNKGHTQVEPDQALREKSGSALIPSMELWYDDVRVPQLHRIWR